MADMNKEALEIWKYLKPMIDHEIMEKTRGMVQRRKATVTTAPANSVIGVKEPFGDEMLLPYMSSVSNAVAGDVVWIEFVYGMTNAFVSMFADPTVG